MHTPGIHHITGITGDAQKNIDFYTGVLGLRFVKLTVNFDDPRAYHLYYGNESGEPGTALTFFAWPKVAKGVAGSGEITAIAFAVPAASLPFWKTHLKKLGIAHEERERFDSSYLSLADPDGLELELVPEEPLSRLAPWRSPLVPPEHAIRGFHAVTLAEDGSEATRRFLTEHFGYTQDAASGSEFRYVTKGQEPARYLHVRIAPDLRRGVMGAGTVHHVAFRAQSGEDELGMRDEMLAVGMDATPVIDRMYFRSVYFREPGGILFEIATDEPGFTVDEPLENLGTSLRLPPQYEPHREEISRLLPKLKLPSHD
jgi:glyoxalase family protein